jgi:hypothetical protein
MKARQQIAQGGFDPEDVAYLTSVLEDVWKDVQSNGVLKYHDESAQRERIALIIVALASRGEDRTDFKAAVWNQFVNSR